MKGNYNPVVAEAKALLKKSPSFTEIEELVTNDYYELQRKIVDRELDVYDVAVAAKMIGEKHPKGKGLPLLMYLLGSEWATVKCGAIEGMSHYLHKKDVLLTAVFHRAAGCDTSASVRALAQHYLEDCLD